MIDLRRESIKHSAVLPLSACELKKPELLVRHGIDERGSVLLFLLPYLTPEAEGGNLSVYAAPRDYHKVAGELSERIISRLRALRPNAVFAAYADHSPIAEKPAACRAGLGVIGKNTLLINSEYGSFVFICGIYSSLHADEWEKIVDSSATKVYTSCPPEGGECTGCDAKACACVRACPTGAITPQGVDASRCLSAISQKKRLTDAEKLLLARSPYAWGCDLCQLACPINKNVKKNGTAYTPIKEFKTEVINTMDEKTLDKMTSDSAFADRAYSWRGEETIARNLKLQEGSGVSELAEAIIQTVLAAGKELTRVTFVQDGLLVKSGDQNFATEYDVKTQERLIRELSSLVPDAHFLAEEESEAAQSAVSAGKMFVIDPIDGTTNFMHDLKHSAVSVALLEDGKTVFGCVYNPYLDECFFAEAGRGAYLRIADKTEKISVSERPLSDSLVAFGTTPYEKQHAEATFARVIKLFRICRDVRREGSAALDMCYVAAGRYDVYFELGLSPWDFAAGALILAEADGILTDLDGGAIAEPKKTSVLAANRASHAEALETLAKG